MVERVPDSESHSESDAHRWPAALLKTLRCLSWALFVYSTPGMLLLVLLVTAWLVPGVVVLLTLAVLQVPVFLLVRRAVRPQVDSSGALPAANIDPRFTADYWSGRTSADFGSSRNT